MSAPTRSRHLISARVTPAANSSARVTTPCAADASRAITFSVVVDWGRTVTPIHHDGEIRPLAPPHADLARGDVAPAQAHHAGAREAHASVDVAVVLLAGQRPDRAPLRRARPAELDRDLLR